MEVDAVILTCGHNLESPSCFEVCDRKAITKRPKECNEKVDFQPVHMLPSQLPINSDREAEVSSIPCARKRRNAIISVKRGISFRI